MRMVEFTKAAAKYQPGDVASFDDAIAALYVRAGVGFDAGKTPVPPPRVPHPGEPDYDPSKHAALHGVVPAGALKK